VLSANFHAFGRYSLPLASSIIAIVSCGKKYRAVTPILLAIILFGASYIALFVKRFYLGLPPM
jgi:hypothetical protein